MPNIRGFNRVRTRPTREGLIYLVLSLFVGFAALNTGNNLLFLIFGMMLSFIALSGIISMINLSRIDVRYEIPQNIFALTPTSIKFFLANKKILIPSYLLTIEIEGEKAFLPYLPTKVTNFVSIRRFFKHRGWNTIPQIYISTTFPFGFFRKWMKINSGNEDVLVYPRVEKIGIDEAKFRQGFGERQTHTVGFGTDIKSIRSYQDGDNPKLIHWKSSAKIGELMIRELQDDDSKGAIIKFNPTNDKTRLELQISRAASLLLELIKQNYEVEFIAPDKTFTRSEINRSPKPVLSYLALYGNQPT